MLSNLKGIKGKRIEQQESSNLEVLLDIERGILDEIDLNLLENIMNIWNPMQIKNNISEGIKNKLSLFKEPLSLIDLEGYVFNYLDTEVESKNHRFRGIFTGCVAEIITENNKPNESVIRLDGKNGYFSYLLAYANNLDTVHISNFGGDNIMFCISYVKNIIAENIKGVGLLAHATDIDILAKKVGIEKKDSIDNLIIIGVNGDNALSNAAYSGRIKNIVVRDAKGIFAHNCGGHNKIDNFILMEVYGDYNLSNIGSAEKVIAYRVYGLDFGYSKINKLFLHATDTEK